MRRFTRLRSCVAIASLLALPVLPAAAKDDPKAKDAKGKEEAAAGPHLRWAHSYGEAMAEARERGAVVFATFHEDG